MRRFAVMGSILLLASSLIACCPPALQGTPTAFRAEVLGTTPAASLLQLQQGPGSPLLSVGTAGVRLEAADGTPLELAAFRPGDSVYLVGTMTATGVSATEVQRLE